MKQCPAREKFSTQVHADNKANSTTACISLELPKQQPEGGLTSGRRELSEWQKQQRRSQDAPEELCDIEYSEHRYLG